MARTVDVNAVIQRALADDQYARTLAEKAMLAARQGVRVDALGSQEWQDLLREFAVSPDDLARMRRGDPGDAVAGVRTVSLLTTGTLTITTTTAACTTTTTTPVTTVTLCTQPENPDM